MQTSRDLIELSSNGQSVSHDRAISGVRDRTPLAASNGLRTAAEFPRPLRVVIAIGTRPEAIKLAPVVHELAGRPDEFETIVVSTGQHREMLQQVFQATGIEPDIDLDLMRHDQGLVDFATLALPAFSKVCTDLKPDLILVQGDTTTVTMAALAGYYNGVAVGHVEAGLRSFDMQSPFPEEGNRRVAGVLTEYHFAPTEGARANLLREGVPSDQVFVTGNTVVDALRAVQLDGAFESEALSAVPFGSRRVLLVTSHRRENHGVGLRSICRAVHRLVEGNEDIAVVFPVHPNPTVRSVVEAELGDVPRVHLVEPLGYEDLVKVMSRATLILSDSGGIQEEAPSFRAPILILRDTTERPEVVECGAGVLVGTDADRIVLEAQRLLHDPVAFAARADVTNPFGDGLASRRIADVLSKVRRVVPASGRADVLPQSQRRFPKRRDADARRPQPVAE